MHITCAKPGRGVSCLSRRPGMSLCLGTKHKCLWDIGQGGVTGLGPSHQPCIFEKIHVYACQSRWYLLGLLKDVRERGGQPSLLSEELERSVQTIITAGVLSLDIFFTSVLSWALIPELSRAQMSGLCNHQQSGLFCFLELLEQRVPLPRHPGGTQAGSGGGCTLKGKAGLDFTCLGGDRDARHVHCFPLMHFQGICWCFSPYAEGEKEVGRCQPRERRMGSNAASCVRDNLTQQQGHKHTLFNQMLAAEIY